MEFWVLNWFCKAIIFASFQDDGKCYSHKQWLKRLVTWTNGFRGSCLRHSLGMPSIPQAFLNLRVFIILCTSQDLTLSSGSLSAASNKAWMRASTSCSWCTSHRSCGENWVSSQSAVTLAFSNGRNLSPVGLWMADGAFVLSPLIRGFTRGQIVWGVISTLLSFVSHLSIAFRQTILRIVLVTQLRAVLQVVSLVLCHSFRSLHLSCRKWSKREGEFVCCKPICQGNRGREDTGRSPNLLNGIGLEPRVN
jgi:hypothetical protein